MYFIPYWLGFKVADTPVIKTRKLVYSDDVELAIQHEDLHQRKL